MKITSYFDKMQKKHLATVHKCSKSMDSTGEFNSAIFANSWAQRVVTDNTNCMSSPLTSGVH